MKSFRRFLVLAGALAIFAACTTTPPPASRPPAPKPPTTAVGRYLASRAPLFPAYRVVAYYGEAGVPAMGVLAHGTLPNVTLRLQRQAAAYARFGRPVIPAFELIAVAAQYAPGANAQYHGPVDTAAIRRYLAAARAMSGLLVIDVQPGRSRFLPLVKQLAAFLREPDVGIALDPEWEMGPNEVPGATIGGTTGAEVNEVARYVAAIVRSNHLPQKLFLVHEFTPEMIADRSAIVPLPELVMTYHIDGFGPRAKKIGQYHLLIPNDPHIHVGIKVFYTQDVDMFAPRDVMKLKPQPDLITYQ